jgi:hypothetical protein
VCQRRLTDVIGGIFAYQVVVKDTKGTKDTKDAGDTNDRRWLRPNEASRAAIACALTVHSALGAGMLESAICACLLYELTAAGLHVQHQVRLPVIYRGVKLTKSVERNLQK